MQTFLSTVPQAPPDPILGIAVAFNNCKSQQKVNLGIGAYRDDNGNPVILDCVKQAQKRIIDQNMNNEYLPVEGSGSFIKSAMKLAYGQDFLPLKENRVAGIQSLSGTGAIRLGFDFINKFARINKEKVTAYIPNFTWPNHANILTEIHFPQKNYRYYNAKTNGLDFDGLLEDLTNALPRSIIIFHACSHNPTGVDPSQDQWQQIKKAIIKNQMMAFFDSAYQGFTTGNITQDSYAVRLFSEGENIPFILGQSFAKNFGLYGQRVGCLSVVCDSEKQKNAVQSQLGTLARRMYSNPPIHGARLVDIILNDPILYKLWLNEVKIMADRIQSMRDSFVKSIKKNGSTLNWKHIISQIGMFAYTGVNPDQVKRLINDFHIYLSQDGRISIAGLNSKNIDYVTNAFHKVTCTKS